MFVFVSLYPASECHCGCEQAVLVLNNKGRPQGQRQGEGNTSLHEGISKKERKGDKCNVLLGGNTRAYM